MSLPPLSRTSLSPSAPLATGRTEQVSSQPRNLPVGPCAQHGSPLQKRLMTDGFDSPSGAKQAGGVDATVRVLSQMAELLAQSVRMLASELGAGAQPTAGATSPRNGDVPDLGAPPKAQAAPTEGVSAPKGGPKGERTMTFTNDGTAPMSIQFTPNAGEAAIPSLTLKPGETLTQEFPHGWSGNFRSTAGDGKAATLGEVKFNGGGNQTYYDVSYIEGANAAMTIQPESGGRKSGTLDNLLASAPDAIKARDANGEVYGIQKTTTSNVQDPAVVDYYRKHVGADQGYVIPTDDASTLGSGDSHLSVRLKNLT